MARQDAHGKYQHIQRLLRTRRDLADTLEQVDRGRVSLPAVVAESLREVLDGNKEETGLDVLGRLLESKADSVRVDAVSALPILVGPPVTQGLRCCLSLLPRTPTRLLNGLADTLSQVRLGLLNNLGRYRKILPPDDLFAAISRLLEDSDANVVRSALGELPSFGIDRSSLLMTRLITLLEDRDTDVRTGAAEVLGWLGVDAVSAVPALSRCIGTSEPKELRLTSAGALVAICPEGKELLDQGEETIATIIEALRELGETGRFLRQQLQESKRHPPASIAGSRESVKKPQKDPGIEAKNIFRKSGSQWEIKFNGGRLFPMPDLCGLSYIREMLRRPNLEVDPSYLRSALALDKQDSDNLARKKRGEADLAQLEGGNAPAHLDNAGETCDEESLRQYAKRIQSIDDSRFCAIFALERIRENRNSKNPKQKTTEMPFGRQRWKPLKK